MDDLACGRSSSGFTLHHDGTELGRIELPDRRRAQRPQRGRGRRHRARAGCTLRGRPCRPGPLRRGRPSFRAPRRGGRHHVHRRLRPPADRGGRRARRPPGPATGAGSCASSSRTATAAPPRCGPSSPVPSATPTCWRSPTSIPPARRPGPASRASSSPRRCSTPIRGDAWPTCPVAPTWSRYLGRELRPGDLCLTLGAGDLTSLPEDVQEQLHPSVVVAQPAGRGGPRHLDAR